MFKIESYITPILLSYVNRYIQNFKPEDSQVSLWGGAASFNNLELNLHVLEQELQLPFSFVSGSIRELIIHVPWTRITSEPITITINTIECILNLKGKDSIPRTTDGTKKPAAGKVVEAPPGYIQSLINKIVSNISIHCNNLILKYVEEDIVLSMNVKHLKFESANEKWEPAYTDLSPAQVILRKVITVNDLTLCLDKRNASGKIEVYQEPMLYKCSMTMHLLRLYHSATASRASTTRLDVYCNNMEFSMTEQQVPMLLRLLMLLYALQQKQLKQPTQHSKETASASDQNEHFEKNPESWSGWAWSYVSSVLPAPWEEEWNNEQLRNFSGHTLHIGFYVDKMSVTFKVSESSSERGYYSQKKLRYWPLLTLQLQGIYCDTVIHGLTWFNATGGISQAVLIPVGTCSCSQAEVTDSDAPIPYLKIGSSANYYKTDSLFDAEAVENRGKRREYTASWDNHMTIFTESVLLERTPAFAFDYVYQVELPSDQTSDILSDLGSNFEFSNLAELASMRLCIGPFKLRLCSGLLHRTSSLQVAASSCEYPPYYLPKPEPSLHELLPASEEDFDALSEFIPRRTMRITFFAPHIELELLNHPYFIPVKGHLFKKVKKLSVANPLINAQTSNLPKLTIECQLIDISTEYPMYPNRLVHTTCQLPEPPKELFDACYTKRNVKILGVVSKLVLNSMKHSIIMTPSSVSYSCRSILKPQYWVDSNIPHEEVTLESESVTLNGTKAKLLVISNIIEKLMLTEPEPSWKNIYSSTLLLDASKDYGFPHMEFCIEGIRFRKVTTNSTVTIDMSLGSIQAFIFEPIDVKLSTNLDKFSPKKSGAKRTVSKNIQQILFISGPEPKPVEKGKSPKQKSTVPDDNPLFTATLQYPLSPDLQKHPPILIFNLQEIRICVDPLLCKFLLYVPKNYVSKVDYFDGSPLTPHTKTMSDVSTPSIAETSRKLNSHIGSVHSTSSDKDYVSSLPPKVQIASKEEPVDVQEQVYNFLKRWFDVWKGMMLCGDISQCTIYFPLVSLSAVGSQGIQEAVEQAVNKENPPNIMVIALPFANIRSAQRQSVSKYLRVLPVTFPENIWSADKSSFPWTMSISELSCYTIQFGNKLIFLKPVSLSATVGLSTRPSKVTTISSDSLTSSVTSKSDIGYLGVCVHIDMTPILITTSEIQVYLFANVLYGLIEVVHNLKPAKRKYRHNPKVPEAPSPLIAKGSSTMSPTNLRDPTLDSASEITPPIGNLQSQSVEGDNVKLTAWVQWTITRFTIELLSNEYRGSTQDDVGSPQPQLKLVVDAEDIVSSLDFQSVYLKIKSKIGSASVQHYKRTSPTSNWEPGAFSGIVMRLRDDITTNQRQEDNGFVSVTITRASCQHTHTLWGALQSRRKDKKMDVQSQFLSKTRYITETVVNIQPVDFVISFHTLRSFYLVVAPLLSIHGIKKTSLEADSSSSVVNTVNNQTLPLAYFECQNIRVIMPSTQMGGSEEVHDVVILQTQKISLTPTPVNPICRKPLRADIYEQAAHARILNIPGSEVEDRQYQLDLVGISLCSGAWQDIASIFSTGNILSNLRGMSENPALEWNNLEQGQPNMTPSFNLLQVTDKFDITVIAAPAMIYKDTTIVCGHSVEVNFVSDIFLNVSLRQIRLVSSLICELVELISPHNVEEDLTGRSDLKFPYSYLDLNSYRVDEEPEPSAVDPLPDSGIDTSDIRSLLSIRAQDPSKSLAAESDKFFYPTRSSHPLNYAQSYTSELPLDILFSAGKIGLILYEDIDFKKSSAIKIKGKRKRTSKMLDEDNGYDAGEESVEEKTDNYKKYIPLLYVCVNQPNAFMSKQQIGRTLQISCFDLNLKVGSTEYSPISNVPTEDDFAFHLLKTRSGAPDPSTGVIQAFFTLKLSKGVNKNSQLDIDLSKPTTIICKTSYWAHILTIKDKVLENFSSALKSIAAMDEICSEDSMCVLTTHAMQLGRHANNASSVRMVQPSQTYQRYQDIKEALGAITVVNLASDQLIFAFLSESGPELHVGVQHLKDTLTLFNRPEKLCNKVTLECISHTVVEDNVRKVLLNPWTVTVEFCLFWESWQIPESDPQIHVTLESDCIVVDVTSDQIKCLQAVTKDWSEFISAGRPDLGLEGVVVERPESPRIKTFEKDQHYKDDLRAGAFQFVDASTNNTDELPLPYQVMFWNSNISAMAWKYPQPRALTKVRVFPVPYKVALNTEDNLLVLCHLEYWSECRNCYMPYTQFYLSESEVCHLSLPQNCPKNVVASTWRVVITTVSENDDLPHVTSDITISPRALAACMRIDSYFNKCLVPNLNVSLYITKIDVSLYTYFCKTASIKLPDFLKHYTSDLLFPENQKFLTLSLDNLTGYFTTWNFEVISVEVSSSVRCNVTDYTFLTEQSLVDPFTCKLQVCFSDQLICNFISKPIQVKFGPSIAHTLAVSTQLWEQSDQSEVDFIVMTRYVVCNDTNMKIRFGQTRTEEDILLAPRHFHLYSWRSQRKRQQLKVALEGANWLWSKSFTIFSDGTQSIYIGSESINTLFITVKTLSATQKQVVISGQLVISNMLSEHFEMKIVEAVTENKDVELKNAPVHVIPAKKATPSIFISNKKKYYLRLRFYGLEAAWTGDIPLREHASGSQPWLVKVPLQERGQFLSIWCRIVIQDLRKSHRILAVLWPLFMIKSNLPVSAKVHIETPTLNVHLDSVVNGRGEMQQLYCPGTIDHSHHLTFHLDNENININANPYVPLNYSLVDQQKFFKKTSKVDIDDILEVLRNYSESKWPYFGDDLDNIEWNVDNQPLTHVQVRYQNACQYSCALLVELLPWCLIVNTLGTPISVVLNGVELCRLQHHGIVAPPKLEENFHLGVHTGGNWSFSGPLQLAKSDWSQSFYMPKITGTIPLEGTVKTMIKSETHISMVSIASVISNEIRLLKVTSTHVFSNHMAMQMQVVCLAVPDVGHVFDLPTYIDKYAFTVAPHMQNSHSGIPIIQWYTVTPPCDVSVDYALYMVFCVRPELGWSCPIRVDKVLFNRSFCVMSDGIPVPVVLTAQESKGQIFLAIHNNPRPQLFIDNKTQAIIYCGQSLAEEHKVAKECDHLRWNCRVGGMSSVYYAMPILAEKFPELPQNSFCEKISLATFEEEGTGEFQWSSGVNIANNNDLFAIIPYFGDVKLTIVNTACTTFLTISSVSELEISAKDIRVRLSMQELEPPQKVYLANRNLDKFVRGTNLAFDTKHDFPLSPGSSNLSFESCQSVGMTPSKAKSLLVNTIPMRDDWKMMTFNAFVKSFEISLISDYDNFGEEKWELANFACDDIVVQVVQDEQVKIRVSASDVQLDNQLYTRESYDFPVVLIGENRKPMKKQNILSIPIESLTENCDDKALVVFNVVLETWMNQSAGKNITGIKTLKVKLNPISCFIEDIYITRLMDYLKIFIPNALVMWPNHISKTKYIPAIPGSVHVPEVISWECAMLARPLTIRNFSISPVALLLSVHSSMKLYIALDQSPLQFSKFERRRIFTTPYRLGHSLTMHYLSGAIFGAGWVVSSLELLGSPGGLARAMGEGLRDFVSLPYRGLVQGPMAFLKGITHGSASLMRHITAGTLQSVTKLASSVARNLDRLTLDDEHLKRTEEQRRSRPQGVAQGFLQGLTGLGVSLLGAVGGIAHHPLQCVLSETASPRSLAAGVGLGIVGVFTKPLSGAAELVALTGQGLLQGAGWNSLPSPRSKPQVHKVSLASNSALKYTWKLMNALSNSRMLFVTEATSITAASDYDAVALILTTDVLVIVNIDEDETVKVVGLNEINPSYTNDPTLLSFKLVPPPVQTAQKTEDELVIEMDPASRARVADYVRSTAGLLNLPEAGSEHSDISISPLSSPGMSPNPQAQEFTVLQYYVSPQNRNYFLRLLALAKQQFTTYHFPVL